MRIKSKGPGLFILDACVLLDFVKTDRAILRLVAEFIGELFVPRPLLSEIRDATEMELSKVGISIIDPEWEQMGIAANRRGSLSFNDHLCLLMAMRLGYTCITNDKALLKACSNEGVPTIRGLGLLLKLVSVGAISKQKAIKVGRMIHTTNSYHINVKILEQFLEKLNDSNN